MAILGDSTAISMNVLNTVEAGTIKKRGGTSSQFLMADGSVSTHSGMDKVGTVTSVAASAGGGISVSGSPITSSGTLTITNTGVRSVTAGSTANVIKVNTNGSEANITINNVAHATSADSATTASKISTEAGTDSTNRPVFFAYSGDNTRVVYDNDFKYNPGTNTLSIGTGTLTATQYSGNAATATNATNATNATTATNLANKPSLTWSKATSASAGSTLSVTAGGKTSDAITIDKVRAAFTADSATTATNLANKPSLTWSKATSASAGSTLTVTAGGKTSDAITIDKVRAAFTADSATNATTATNLANKPSLTWSKATSASAGSTLTVTAGGKESDLITIDKVRAAFTADSATNATNATNATTATNLANKPSLTWTAASSASAGSTLTVTAGGKTSDAITINKVRAAFTADSATKATQDGSGNTITSTYVKKSGDTMTGSLTATSFVKSGGTASQFLMANGSVKTLSTTVSQNDSNPVSGGAVWSFCDEFEEVTATALNYLNLSKQDKLTAGSGIALTQASGSAIISVAGVPREVLSATHAGLVQLRNNNRLVPGQWYRITDYTCTTTQTDTKSAGHVFDILVMATSYNTLAPDAYACHHEGDTYFAESNLSAWKLWYCLDNDTSRFGWADTTNGKGVVYRMIDEHNNDCPYDFKNIQFKRYKVTAFNGSGGGSVAQTLIYNVSTNPKYYGCVGIDGDKVPDKFLFASDFIWYYTFSGFDLSLNVYDMSSHPFKLSQSTVASLEDSYDGANTMDRCDNNIIFPSMIELFANDTFFTGKQALNNIVFIGNASYDNGYDAGFSTASMCGNKFGVDCKDSTFGDSCNNNTFGNSCSYNTFGSNCHYNTFGNNCSSITFGNHCYRNTLRNVCVNFIFGNLCYYNTFGNSCNYSTFGNSCISNTFGNSCSYNTFGNSCSYNTFGSNCGSNTFGNSCSSNTFGNSCRSIKFTNSSGATYNYYRNNHFGDGCQYLYFTGAGTASTNAQVQNYNFAQGLNTVNSSTTPSYRTVTGIRSRLYQTYVATNTNNTLRYITITNASITVAS